MSRLVAFLSGEGPDDQGRRICDIATWSDTQLDSSHDYIQWVFPNRAISRFNPAVPVLDDETIRLITTSPAALANIRRLLKRHFTFYTFKVRKFEDGSFQLELENPASPPWWISSGNHNYLRLSRILLALNDFGLHDEFLALADILDVLARKYHHLIGTKTLQHWHEISALLE